MSNVTEMRFFERNEENDDYMIASVTTRNQMVVPRVGEDLAIDPDTLCDPDAELVDEVNRNMYKVINVCYLYSKNKTVVEIVIEIA